MNKILNTNLLNKAVLINNTNRLKSTNKVSNSMRLLIILVNFQLINNNQQIN